MADIWDMPVQLPLDDVPRACLGSAVLAGIGAGIYGDYDEALARRDESTTIIEPQNAEAYVEAYDQYRRLYPLLKDKMHWLAK